MKIRRVSVGVGVATAVVFGSSGMAAADHTHSMKTGNGRCVLLARNGGESEVQLPFASGPDNRRHPLHVLVHMGEPDDHITIGVQGMGSDPCFGGDYIND